MERDASLFHECGGDIHFNSHAHVERDPKTALRKTVADFISTHTLTWSVTGLN